MSLRDKLKRIKNEDGPVNVDWQARKVLWLKQLSELYTQIQSWLEEYKREGYLEFSATTTLITEDQIGQYSAPILKISIGNRTLIFEPIGTLIIGAQGRVDFYISGYQMNKNFLLLRKDESGQFEWLIADPKNIRKAKKLDKITIENVIDSWI